MRLDSCARYAALAFALVASAHPGHEHDEHEEALRRREFRVGAKRGLEKCADKLEARGHNARAAARRQAIANQYSKRGEISARDTDSVLNTSHHSSEAYTSSTSETTIFASNNTCVLNPEGETGPYFVKGEYIRKNLRDGQEGVPVILDGQFVDVETCEPIENLYWDVWNCNATGVYSGLVATGNGNTADTSNLNATFLRGLQPSDSDGVVQFLTVFPGHYSGRTTHIHMVAHIGATVLSNNTLSGGSVAHIGQLFWDQDLITEVEATSPYNTNTVTITPNSEDRVFTTETADTTSDPVLEYVMLGDDLSDGLLAWATIAVNVSATYDPNYSFVYTSGGSIAESGGTNTVDGGGSGSGGAPSGSGGPGGNTTMGGNATTGGTGTTSSNSSSTTTASLAVFTNGMNDMASSVSLTSAGMGVALALVYFYLG